MFLYMLGLVQGLIIWDVDPVIFRLGQFEARWYGICFAMAFILGQYFIAKIFRAEGKPDRDVEALTLYMVVATVVGARLGHCLFYEPEYFLTHPIEILKVWKGGLASHGATVGIIVAMILYPRGRPGQSPLWILDRVVIVIALGGACIRFGNLMNSEIIGKPSGDVPYAFVFAHAGHVAIEETAPRPLESIRFATTAKDLKIPNGDELAIVEARIQGASGANPQALLAYGRRQIKDALFYSEEAHEHFRPEEGPQPEPTIADNLLRVQVPAVPRHAAQLYECLSCIVLFIFLYRVWATLKGKTPEGRLFGLFCLILFTLRFFYEFLKENQVAFEDRLALNMGQWLSIPMILVGAYFLWQSYAKPTLPDQAKA